jgi:hypothetical protein
MGARDETVTFISLGLKQQLYVLVLRNGALTDVELYQPGWVRLFCWRCWGSWSAC